MKYVRLLAGVAILAAALGPRDGESCGPFQTYLLFSTSRNFLSSELSSGRLGVLRPEFRRSDLLLAYRVLSGVPLSAAEPSEPPYQGPPSSERAKPWLDARVQVPGVRASPRLDADKKVPGADYQFYPNCLAGAFENAAATLGKRIAQWGASSPQVAEWVRGQDQVFANCSAGPQIPAPLDTGDPLLLADRRYQIAAAKLYAAQYQDAAADFDQIAADAASPWYEIAPYLAARACIRMATMDGDDTLPQAADRLRAVIADPSRTQWHKPAQDLLDFVRARQEPGQRLVELGNQLMQPNQGPQLGRVLSEYTTIWRASESNLPVKESEIADWVATIRGADSAIQKWQEKRTLPWLIAALIASANAGPALPDLLAAAHTVPPASPGFASSAYYGIQAEIRESHPDEARLWADEALSEKPPDSAANLFRAQRLQLARDWSEFLHFAPRKPVALGSDIDDYDEPLPKDARPVALDGDSTGPLNQAVPLHLWIDACRPTRLPRLLQTDIAQAGWVRAAILGDTTAARGLATRLAQLKPELAAEMRAYLAERDPAAAKFYAVFLMLRAPGLEPVVRYGSGRQTPVLKQDIFRDNWWDLLPRPGVTPPQPAGPANFLTEDQRAAGEREWKRLLETAANSVNYLCTETIAWAHSHPQDPRVPQALYLAVEATHYGPSAPKNPLSQQAFDLLHRTYPNSEWTQKTKYWY